MTNRNYGIADGYCTRWVLPDASIGRVPACARATARPDYISDIYDDMLKCGRKTPVRIFAISLCGPDKSVFPVDILCPMKKGTFMCKISLADFKNAGSGTYGNISAMAKKLGVSRNTVYRFMESNPEAAEFIVSQRDEFDDIAEECIRKSILEGDHSMLRFYASTRLRKRGYAKEDGKECILPPEFTVRIEKCNDRNRGAGQQN